MPVYSRRTILVRGIQGLGLLGIATRPHAASAALVPGSAELIGKATAFLRTRQGADGSWSGRGKPGITARVVTASCGRAGSRRLRPRSRRGSRFSTLHRPQGRAVRNAPFRLHDVGGADGVS